MQGMIDFAVLIEQADPLQKQTIIDQAQAQDAEFLHKAMKKVVFFEELPYLDEGVLAELVSKVSAKVLAYSLHGMPDDFRKSICKLVGLRELRQLKEEEDRMGKTINAALVLGGQRQILKTARSLESQNKIIFELTSCPRFAQKKRAAAPDAAKKTDAQQAKVAAGKPTDHRKIE